MRAQTDPEVKRPLSRAKLITGLEEAFAKCVSKPMRSAQTVPVPDEPDATFLAMPASEEGGKPAVNVLIVTPGNSSRNLPAVNASAKVFDVVTGQSEMAMEGAELTACRTAATSALAATSATWRQGQ